MSDRNKGVAPWWLRRRLVLCTLAFDVGIVVLSLYLASTGKLESSVANTAITMGFTNGAAVLGTYVFGAVWNDRQGGQHADLR